MTQPADSPDSMMLGLCPAWASLMLAITWKDITLQNSFLNSNILEKYMQLQRFIKAAHFTGKFYLSPLKNKMKNFSFKEGKLP